MSIHHRRTRAREPTYTRVRYAHRDVKRNVTYHLTCIMVRDVCCACGRISLPCEQASRGPMAREAHLRHVGDQRPVIGRDDPWTTQDGQSNEP